MRQIINIDIPENAISLKQVKITDYIGVHFFENSKDAEKGFVTKTEYESSFIPNSKSTFTIRCLSGLTIGNGWDSWDNPDFKTFLNRLVNDKIMRVYFFSSFPELVMWLINTK